MEGAADGDRRVVFLDALRGVAILGILPVNAAVFALPSLAAVVPEWPPGSGPAPAVAHHAVTFLFEYKFITLFNLLFGVGLAILRAGARERGEAWAPIAVRRLVFLWLVGCLHAVLVWYGDILAYYGLLGLALCWTPGRSPFALKAWGAALLALPLLGLLCLVGLAILGGDWLAGLLSQGAVATALDGRTPGWTPGSWEGFGEQLLKFDPDFETAVFRDGPLLQAVVLRGVLWMMALATVVPYFVPRMAGLMLLGVAFAGEGWFLRPGTEEGRRCFGRMLRWGLWTGVPLEALGIALALGGQEGPARSLASEAAHYAGSLGLAAAIAALVARACAARPDAGWIRALAATGRMAFSNYLLQSVVMSILFCGTTIFLGAGFGLFGSLGRLPILGIAVALCAVQVACSVLWLRRFRMGPLEWFWRAATRLRFPAMRREGGGVR
jgi:uncharacterized protein